MKIDDRYEIRVVVIELQNGTTGDVYDNFAEFKKEHPFSSYKFGFVVFDTEYGYVPDNCNDWNDSPEEAMFDYEDNCKKVVTKLDREEAGRILDAVDTVCSNCIEDTLNNPGVCDLCPVRKMCNSLEYDDAE